MNKHVFNLNMNRQRVLKDQEFIKRKSGLLLINIPSRKNSFLKKPESRSGSRPGTARTSKNSSKERKIEEKKQKEGILNFFVMRDKALLAKNPKPRPLALVIGKGGFGRVWRVQMKKTKQLFAMKQMSKALIISKKSVPSVINQKKLLEVLRHPFIVNMHYAFQDRQHLYLVMDLLTAGDLRTQMGRVRKFSQQQTKFFIGCVMTSLQFLHGKGVIHRDIKPQNLIFDSKGYLRVTDLGVARIHNPQNSKDTSGTPGYMSPEVLFGQNHSYTADYFAVGVIAYQCLTGRRPYMGYTRNQIKQKIIAKQVQVKKSQIPSNWSAEAVDFINKMIVRKPSQRLGSNSGITEIKTHPWLKNFPWSKLTSKTMPAPFSPYFRVEYVDQGEVTVDEHVAQLVKQNTMLLRKQSIQDMFQGYDFNVGK